MRLRKQHLIRDAGESGEKASGRLAGVEDAAGDAEEGFERDGEVAEVGEGF